MGIHNKKLKVGVIILLLLISTSSKYMNIGFLPEYDVKRVKRPQNARDGLLSESKRSRAYGENSFSSSKTIKLDYIPRTTMEGTGKNFTIADSIQVYHEFSLHLNSTNSFSDSFTITNLENYDYTSLNYNLSITSTADLFKYETIENKDTVLTNTVTMLAHRFQVTWDYTLFSRVRMYLKPNLAGYGSDVLELLLVPEDSFGYPNMSNVLSSDINGPYNASNPLPSSVSGNFAYFDFEDRVLTPGTYFVVANLTAYDTNDNTGFVWRSQQGSTYKESFYYDGSWNGPNVDNKGLTFIAELMPSTNIGEPLNFDDPTDVALQDNGLPILSLNQSISDNGTHILTTNTPIKIEFNNNYLFERSFEATSTFSVTNSTYYSYSISWAIEWNFPIVVFSPYYSPIRISKITTSTDWDNNSFSFEYNHSLSISGTRIKNRYECELNSLIIGDSFKGGSLTLLTTSPNYLFSVNSNSKKFKLGYWTTNGTHSIGHNGSSFIAEIEVKETAVKPAETGVFNFTLYNPKGEIYSRYSSTNPNIIYVDVTDYSLTRSSQDSPGSYSIQTIFDPSIYDSQQEGYWTACYYWQNGSEVGYYSERISVVKQTISEFFWEEEEGQGIWMNDTLSSITRINGEKIKIKSYYFNISDPFFVGLGNVINNGEITYSTSWGTADSLVYSFGTYSSEISINAEAGLQTIRIRNSLGFMENSSIEFSVNILHQLEFEILKTSYHLNYSDDINIVFGLLDITNSSNYVFPDLIQVKVNSTLLSTTSFSNFTKNNHIVLNLNTEYLNLEVGSYEIDVIVSKRNFVDAFMNATVVSTVFLYIEPIRMEVNLVSATSKITTNNQTTISFKLLDTNRSMYIKGADVAVKTESQEVEIITISETDGVYSIVLKIKDISATTLNVFVNITISGYQTISNYLLHSFVIISTLTPTPPSKGGIIAISVILSLLIVLVTIVGLIYYSKRKGALAKKIALEKKTKARRIFQSVMMIKKIVVVHRETSLPVFELNIDENVGIDSSIVSAVLQAISTIGMEISGAPTSIKKIEYYGFSIFSAYNGAYTTYLFADTDIDIIIARGVENISKWFNVTFGFTNTKWDGSMDIFSEYEETIIKKMSEELYLWMLYPIQVSSEVMQKIDEFDNLEKEILSFIHNKGKVTLVLLLDKLKHYEDEVVLEKIIKFHKENLIITTNSG
ncbi:MAG: hypothetical protein ACTSSG_10825 [Candidatus Heimdallarchaeaceae archaeon]